MSTLETFRASALAIAELNGAQAVTLERGAVGLFEAISGAVPTLTCGTAAQNATSVPLAGTANLSGRVSPGTTLQIAGHAATYAVQAPATPLGAGITLSVDPGLEAAISGEVATLSARSLSFTGQPVKLTASRLPAGWEVGAEQEVWALVPPATAAGREPRSGDRITSPFAGTVHRVAGRERSRYLVLVTPHASEEAA